MLFNLAYLLALALFAPYLAYAALRHGKYRQGWPEKFWGRVPPRTGDQPCVWLHAVSVGEVNLLASVVERFTRQRPTWQIVISTTTRTGYELARQKYPAQHVVYAPLDFSWAVRQAFDRLRPQLVLLAELEVWPNFLAEAERRGVPVAVVNGRLSERSFRGYRRLAWLLRGTFARLRLVAAQSEEYAARFRALGVHAHRAHVTGSIKFDNAQTNRANPRTQALAELAGITPTDVVFLAGSTQDPEEDLALKVFARLAPRHANLRLILVPRHAERFEEVAALLQRSQVPWQRRSALSALAANPAARVLLVDTVGELGAWWGTAHVAFVGGSLGTRGGQNMLEPAAYGAAVSFGPNTRNFRDIVDLMLAHEAAVVIRNEAELEAFVLRCLNDAAFAQTLGARAQALVRSNQGALDRTWSLLETLAPLLPEATRRAA